MKILILGINYAPEIISTAVYSTDLAEWLARRGHSVRVFTAHPYFPDWKIFTGYPKFGYRRVRPEPNLIVTHCPHYVPRTPTGARRILHHTSFAGTALLPALWHGLTRRPDVVLVVVPSMISSPVGWLAAKLAGAKTWMHIQDFEVEAAFATGLLPRTGVVAKLARFFERWCLNRFDLLTSISGPMLAKLSEKGVPDGRVGEFRNWADFRNVTPIDGEVPLKSELGITTPHVALYAGNIANKQGIEIVPETARLMAARTDLTFVIAGAGPALAEIRARAEGLDNVAFFPLQPKERLGELLGLASVHLLPLIAEAADLGLPSKLTNMLASGRPIIATGLPGTALANEVDGAGLITAPGDAAEMANALNTLLDDAERRKKLGAAARKRALDRWNRESILMTVEKRLAGLVGDRATDQK